MSARRTLLTASSWCILPPVSDSYCATLAKSRQLMSKLCQISLLSRSISGFMAVKHASIFRVNSAQAQIDTSMNTTDKQPTPGAPPSEPPSRFVCSTTLIVTRVTYAPHVADASWRGIPRHGAHPKETMALYSSETSREMRPRHFRGPLDCDWERLRFHNERTSRTQRGGMRRARL